MQEFNHNYIPDCVKCIFKFTRVKNFPCFLCEGICNTGRSYFVRDKEDE